MLRVRIMKKNIFLIFIFLCVIVYAADSPTKDDTVEENFIFIRINGVFSDPFFRVYSTEDGKKVYVPLNSFIEFTGIKTLEVDTVNKNVTGTVATLNQFKQIKEEKFFTTYSNSRYLEKEEEIFVEIQSLKKVLNLKNLFWDENRSFLAVDLGYLLPFEVKDIQEKKRYDLDSVDGTVKIEDKIITPEKKLFSPGVLRLEYFLSDFEDRGTQNFSALYNNQLLYGEFNVQTTLYPETKLNLITLKYRDKLEDKVITFGDVSLEKNNVLSVKENFIRGFNITDNGFYTEIESGKLTIRGPVANGTTVELYQNDILLALQVVTTSNEYVFEDISIFGFEENFMLKFYYPNGRIEERDITVMNDNDIQDKGESDYSIQLGESDNSIAASAKYLYGVSDNITLGTRYLKANSTDIEDLEGNEESNEFNIAEGILILRTRAKKNPTLYRLNWLADLDNNGDGTFRSRINKRLWKFDTELYYDEYSDELTEVERNEREYGALISHQLGNFAYTLGYEVSEFLDGDETTYSLDTRYYLNDSTRLQLNNMYREFEREDNEYEGRFSIAYSGFEKFNTIFRSQGIYKNGEWSDEFYSIGIAKRNREFRKNDVDYSAEVSYSDEEWKFTIYFTYYLTDWLSFPTRFTNDDQEAGVAVEKTFILSRLFKESSNPEPNEAWVEGFVYRDENLNNIKDPEEEAYEGIDISVGGLTATTNKDGYYYVDALPSNYVYDVTPAYKTVDPLLRFTQDQYKVKPIPATGQRLDFTLSPIIAIFGDVELTNKDFSPQKKARAFQQVKIYIIRGGEIVSSNTAESDGFFTVEDIIPGKYKVEAKYLGEEELEIEKVSYELDVKKSESGDFYEGFDFKLVPKKILQ